MKILLIGSEPNLAETRLKFGPGNAYTLVRDHAEGRNLFHLNEIVFDFIIADDPVQMKMYDTPGSRVVFLNTTTIRLGELIKHVSLSENIFFGFCGMPTFLNRELLEISVLSDKGRGKLSEVCEALGTQFQVVADQTGLVTPRVIGMIINEAYCTATEGIATKDDIDLAMTLGTNYPQGPFAWGKMIGIKNIYLLLQAMYKDTGDERYRSCEMLNREAGY